MSRLELAIMIPVTRESKYFHYTSCPVSLQSLLIAKLATVWGYIKVSTLTKVGLWNNLSSKPNSISNILIYDQSSW